MKKKKLNSKEIASRNSSQVQGEIPPWTMGQLEVFRRYLKDGDIAKGHALFAAPKDILSQWIRSTIVHIAHNTTSDSVRHECFKTLLNDLNNGAENQGVRVEIVLPEKIETKDAGDKKANP